jgi:hypothetical protein
MSINGGEKKEKLYMVCDYVDGKAIVIEGCPNVGVEHLGSCGGRLLREDGTEVGFHHSSTLDFLRSDLRAKVDNPDDYEFVDCLT